MLRRLLDALRRDRAEQTPQHQFRPNELSLEVVRAERLRREARQAESATRRPAPPSSEEGTPRARQPTAPIRSTHAAHPLAASLKSHSELRRAMLLKEILDPPAALRWPRGERTEQ